MKYPLGIQTFSKIRDEGYVYIDKTALIYELITSGSTYFLSRPRRFGKSLLVSTLESLFRGERSLFKNLAIADTDYDFAVFPVIKLEFAKNEFATADSLREYINFAVDKISTNNDITLTANSYSQRFEELVTELHHKTGQKVVLLVDEYDKPILNNLNSTILDEIRQVMNAFYSVIKSIDEHLKFVLITGVTKFAKVSVFSGMNSLTDISMEREYATLCGLTQQELEDTFTIVLSDLAQFEQLSAENLLAKIKYWYNGYRFHHQAKRIYNPYSLLSLLRKKEFDNYWFATATPSFLLDLLQNRQYELKNLTKHEVVKQAFSACEPENMDIQSLFLQTGYLTIKEYNAPLYKLDFPNYEVKMSFYSSVSSRYGNLTQSQGLSFTVKLVQQLAARQFNQFFETLSIFFANIPYDIQLKKEKYYQSLFYAIFKLIGLSIEAEVKTNKGRIDCVIETDDMICLIEFKLHESKEAALQQIIDTEYTQKYQLNPKQKFLIGVEFNQDERNIGGYQLEVRNE